MNDGFTQEARLALILDTVTDIVFLLGVEPDGTYRFQFVNTPFLSATGLTADMVVGKLVTEVIPEPAHPLVLAKYAEAINGRHAVEWEEASVYPAGERIGRVRVIPIFGTDETCTHLLGTVHDITEQSNAETELRHANDRTTHILESITDAFFALDGEWRFTYINDQAERLLRRNRHDLLGKVVWDEFPEAVGTEFNHQYHIAVTQRVSVTFEAFYPPLDTWFEVRAYPWSDGLSVYFHNITARRTANEERERLLAETQQWAEREALLRNIAQAMRVTNDPEEVQRAAVEALGQALDADRCYFSLFDLEADTNWIGHDFRRCDLPSLAGEYRISDFEVQAEDFYPTERTLIISDAMDPKWDFPEPLVTAIRQLRVRSVLSVPIFDKGVLVATLTVAMADHSRVWTSDEVQTTEAVAALTRSAVESAFLLAEQQAHLREEALIGRIGVAIRSELDPEVIQEKAAALVGEALGADRCFYLTYNPPQDRATVGRDFYRRELLSLAGEYRISEFRGMLDELFADKETASVSDVTARLSSPTAHTLTSAKHHALLAVPFFDGDTLVAALWASMTATRIWTKSDIALIEQAATLTRTALEAARNNQREHAIAQQLQDALQPSIPEQVRNLSIGSFTRPALDEASIGGDFMDVFALDKEQYAIVVGDVSGKGLAAAQQLALIRNTLRTTLYLYRSPAKAATTANAIVTSHDLLIGFVTTFVGVYDAVTGDIAFCSCGHEPGIVRRGNGDTELLGSLGPPLGIAAHIEYAEAHVHLADGDELLLYTDGLSEAGRLRRELLGVERLMGIVASLPNNTAAQVLAEALVAQVIEFADGVLHDDVAVMLLRRNKNVLERP